MINKILGFILVFFIYLLSARATYAVTYDLIAPSGSLTRGQQVQFTINIDTGGQTLKTAQIGMTYKTDVLQYLSTAAGDTFPTVTPETQGGGKLIFTATSDSGFSGSGTFAVVTFKLIASAPGSTELCVLFNPASTPTPGPTTPVSTSAPTSLPKTGSVTQAATGAIVGLTFLLAAGSTLFFLNSKKHPKK